MAILLLNACGGGGGGGDGDFGGGVTVSLDNYKGVWVSELCENFTRDAIYITNNRLS